MYLFYIYTLVHGMYRSNRSKVSLDSNTDFIDESKKLSLLEMIGSVCVDWNFVTCKEDRNGVKTYTIISEDEDEEDGGQETFKELEDVGKYAMEQDDWMKELVEDDEGVADALLKMKQSNNERAIILCDKFELNDVSDDEEDEEGEEDEDVLDAPEPLAFEDEYPEHMDKFKNTLLGPFLTNATEFLITTYCTIADKEDKEMKAKTLEDGKEIQEMKKTQENTPGKQKKVENAIARKKKEIADRKRIHNKHLKHVAEEMALTFMASGFAIPDHLIEKYENKLLDDKYKALAQVLGMKKGKGKKGKKKA